MATENTELARQAPSNLAENRDPNRATMAPPVDIYENNDEILVIADFPGVPTESLTVRLDGSELLIEGSQPAPEARAEWQPLSFARTFRVPATVDPNGISAELRQGVLRVHLAKSETAKPRRIEVQAS